MKALLLALTVAAAAGAYLGGPGATSLLAPRKPTARRCPPPLALAGRWINGPGDKQGDGWTDDDDAALAHHISAHASTAKCGEPERILHGIDSAWVLIFNVGRHDEGVYTLQGRASCPTAYVLAFERTDDAERFAQQLSSEGFDLAKPLQWDVAQISAFCSAGEFEISLVPVRGATRHHFKRPSLLSPAARDMPAGLPGGGRAPPSPLQPSLYLTLGSPP